MAKERSTPLPSAGSSAVKANKAKKPAIRPGAPRMPKNVLLKLFFFTALLFVVPIGGFYLSKYYLFKKNGEVYSALIAVVGANLILLAYILTAFSEADEDSNAPVTPTSEKKNQ